MSLSKGYKFSNAELQALQLWVAPPVGVIEEEVIEEEIIEPEPEPEVEEPPVPTLTLEEIEAMQKQAYDEAFAHGKSDGFEEGKKEGFEEGKKEGYEQGFVEGSKKGYEDNVHLIQNRTAQLIRLLESLTTPFKRLDETVEKELVKLAIALAKQVIRREIDTDPEYVLSIVKEAVNALPSAAQKVVISLHPDDAELVRFTLDLEHSSSQWIFVENDSIQRGGCKVETDVSQIDATIERRLDAVLLDLFGYEPDEEVGHDS